MSLPKVANLQGLIEYTQALKENYLKKTDADELIKKAVAESGHASFESVDEIPSVETAKDNVLYLVPNTESGVMDIYAKVGDSVKKLADTNIDLSGYVQKEEGKELIETTKITKLDGIAENATKVEIGTKEGTILINGVEKTLFEVATEEEIQEVIDDLIGTTPSIPSEEENT